MIDQLKIARGSMLISILIASSIWCLALTAMPQSPSVPRFAELSPRDMARLDQQRAVIGAAIKKRYGSTLSRTTKDISVLQRLVDDAVFGRSQTYELQSLGVVFGDVLASALPLRWVTITDEYGTDPTLRYKQSAVNVNALTMISKRIERGERVSLERLFEITREQLTTVDTRSR